MDAFLESLIKTKDIQSKSVVIVSDNAQLTKENRMVNSESFVSLSSQQNNHLTSRWSSQPTMLHRGGASNSSFTNAQQRKRGGMPQTRTVSRSNASWDIAPVSTNATSSSSTTSCGGGDVRPVLPMSSRSFSSVPILKEASHHAAPKIPERFVSPQVHRTIAFPSTNLQSGNHRLAPSASKEKSEKLRNALGAMAPPLPSKQRTGTMKRNKNYGSLAHTADSSNSLPKLSSFRPASTSLLGTPLPSYVQHVWFIWRRTSFHSFSFTFSRKLLLLSH